MDDGSNGAVIFFECIWSPCLTETVYGMPLARRLSRVYDPSAEVVVAADCCMVPDTTTTDPDGSEVTFPDNLK